MRNKHTLKLGNINTTTCKTDEKLVQSVLAVKNLGQQMCVFSETHRVSVGVELIENWPVKAELSGWKFIGTGNEKKAQSGVGIVLGPDVKLIETEVILKSRILYARIVFRGVKIQIFAVYAPTNMQGETTKSDFFRKLKKSVVEKSENTKSGQN